MKKSEMVRLIDHTLVAPYASRVDVVELCDEAVEYGFRAVTLNPVWISFAAKRLEGKGVLVNATVGFPLGANTAHVKLEEAREAIKHGAQELDMVVNIGALKSGYPEFVEKEIQAMVKAAKDTPVKVIIESSLLNTDEKRSVSQMCVRAGAAYIKTATGYGPAGTRVEDVRVIRAEVGDAIGIKAAGGIRGYRDFMLMVEAGATCIGTSAALKILREIPT